MALIPLAAHARRGPPSQPGYARTRSLGGRTRFGHVLLVETFVAALEAPEERLELTSGDWAAGDAGDAGHRRTLPPDAYGGRDRRAAEMPLGVVRVLLSDLADQGKIRVYGTGHGTGRPDRALLERVLSGLRRL